MMRHRPRKPGPNTYLPDYSIPDPKRPHLRELDTYRPGQDQSRRLPHVDYLAPTEAGRDGHDNHKRQNVPGLPPVRSAISKTKHERKTNPSTRIHSLKNQLQKQQLSALVRQDRERELAALLFEQQKAVSMQEGRKNLQRYHFVRFIERKKAERTFKQLHQRKASPNYQSETQQSDLDKSIHIAEVDINYTKYAPLGDKYISLYPQDEQDKKKDKAQMNRLDFGAMDKEQQEAARKLGDQHANIIRTSSGAKPPMWYEVEKVMEQGQQKLEALRDRKLTTDKQLKLVLATVGGREDAVMRTANGQPREQATPDWLNDDGIIEAIDLDSDQDEDMCDGGFFER